MSFGFIVSPYLIPAAAGGPTFVAAGVGNGDTGNLSLAFPVGHAANDILLMPLQTAQSDPAPPAPSGWTEVATAVAATGAGGVRLSLMWKRDSGAETDPIVIPDAGDHLGGIILAFRGCTTIGNPWDDVQSSNAGSVAGTSLTLPAVTTVGATRLVVAISSAIVNATTLNAEFTGWANANLVSITEIADFTDASGSGSGIGAACGVLAAAGSSGTTAATSTTSEKHAFFTIALKP